MTKPHEKVAKRDTAASERRRDVCRCQQQQQGPKSTDERTPLLRVVAEEEFGALSRTDPSLGCEIKLRSNSSKTSIEHKFTLL